MYLYLHGLRTGRRVYLPISRSDGTGAGHKAEETGVDRFTDRGRDSSGNPGSKGYA